ncbi:hypothetical protein HanPSC8_Chr03g0088711 [Helianthus annuus]|nr:hypothetical protein HanPSC8_Chr03g0088711 [Helianthus annuus]
MLTKVDQTKSFQKEITADVGYCFHRPPLSSATAVVDHHLPSTRLHHSIAHPLRSRCETHTPQPQVRYSGYRRGGFAVRPLPRHDSGVVSLYPLGKEVAW